MKHTQFSSKHVFALFCLLFVGSFGVKAQCGLQVFPNLVQEECPGEANGIASAVGIFGTPPYIAQWTNQGGATVFIEGGLNQGQASNAAGLTAGVYTATFTDATGTCMAQAQVTVTEVANPDDASFNYATSSFCTTDSDPTPTVTGTPGGIFSSASLGLSIEPSTGTIDISASQVGTYSITYTTNGACPDEETVIIQIQDCSSGVPFTQISAVYCGTTMTNFGSFFRADAVAGADRYAFRFQNTSSGAFTEVIKTNTSPFMTLSAAGLTQSNQSYFVAARARVGGVWGDYGGTCTISSPTDLPTTQLRAADCGIAVAAFNTNFYCDPVQGAEDYGYEFTNGSTVTEVERGNANVNMTLSLAGLGASNTTYSVRVRAKYNGVWGAYGPACNITSPALPTTKVRNADCGITVSTNNQYIFCDAVSGANNYMWEFTNGTTVVEWQRNSSSTLTNLSAAGLTAPGVTYSVRVKARVGNTWGDYGIACNITSPGSSAIATNNSEAKSNSAVTDKNATIVAEVFEVSAYPNPAYDQIRITWSNTDQPKTVRVMDLSGKQVFVQNNLMDTGMDLTVMDFETGVYLVEVFDGTNREVIRIMKR